MALATIQITQGTTVGLDGHSVLGLNTTADVTLTDAGGTGGTPTFLWEVLTWPSPMSSAPAITNSTSQVATIAAPGSVFTDGLYVVRLTRTDSVSGTTVDTKFFGVSDTDGLHLPSAGVNDNMFKVGPSPTTNAEKFGYQGGSIASTNVMLDAFLRLRRTREGSSKVSATDTTFAKLSSKLVAGTNVTLTVLNSGGNEQISIASSGGGGGSESVLSDTLSMDSHDYTATGWAAATHVRIASGASVTITGLSPATTTQKYIINVGSYSITLAHNSSSSTAGNRFAIPGGQNLELAPGDVATVWLDSVGSTAVWRLL